MLSYFAVELFSEATKMLKAEYLVKAIRHHRMDQAIIFCRTKLDCDNIESHLLTLGGGSCDVSHLCILVKIILWPKGDFCLNSQNAA